MRVVLLQDHKYPVSQATRRVGFYERRASDGIVCIPAGTMVEINKVDQCMIIAGEATGYKLSDDPEAWEVLMTRSRHLLLNKSLRNDLDTAWDSYKLMEDRARGAEHEARECRAELMQLYTDLLDTQVSFKRMANRIADMGVIRSERMETCAETGPQTDEENSQATRADHG